MGKIRRTHADPRIAGEPLVILERPTRIAPIPGQAYGVDVWLESGIFMHVHSSNVAAIAYSSESEDLFVEFIGQPGKPGATYRYAKVPPSVAREMWHASSMGKFVYYRLRGRFDAVVVSRG